jgi:hypothetical protein
MDCKKMRGMNNIKNGFKDWGLLFAIYKLVLFENQVMRIMFELKTRKLEEKDA